MNLTFQTSLSTSYKNNSQKIRVMSENWTLENGFCPNCGNKLTELENNKKVSDFLCENCLENFEQKASKKKFKGKVISSEYYTLIKRLKEKNKPHFFFLHLKFSPSKNKKWLTKNKSKLFFCPKKKLNKKIIINKK